MLNLASLRPYSSTLLAWKYISQGEIARAHLYKIDHDGINVCESGSRLHIKTKLLFKVSSERDAVNEAVDKLRNHSDVIVKTKSTTTIYKYVRQ